MFSEPPYFVIPEAGAKLDLSILVRGLPDEQKTRVVYPKDMPVALGAPVGGDAAIGVVKATEWVLGLTSDRLAELSAWIIGTYGAKEYIKGFASDAGRDTWKALRSLLDRIGQWSTRKGASASDSVLPLRIEAQHQLPSEGKREFAFSLDPRWTREEAQRRLKQLERNLLPAVFVGLAMCQREPANQREKYILNAVRVDIAPRSGTRNQWWMECEDPLDTRVLVLADLKKHAFQWDKGPWMAGLVAELFFDSLNRHGYTNRGEAPLLQLRRRRGVK